jgi:hypothetical protein
MAFSFATALGSQQQSLEDMLAQREVEQSMLFRLSQEQERRRATQADEAFKKQQLEETLEAKKLAQKTLDEQRTAQAKASAAAAAEKTAQMERENAQRAGLEQLSKDATQPEHVRLAALYKLHGINPVSDVQTGRDRVSENNARAQANLSNAVALMLQRDKLNDDNRAQAEQTKQLALPPEAAQYIASLPQKVDPETGQAYTYERAKAELQRNLARMATGNPALSAQRVFQALDQAFTKPNEDRIMVAPFKPGTPLEAKVADVLKQGGFDVTKENVDRFLKNNPNFR